ncbi:hypothetical protein HHK36_031403 (mitochondrion) [Tetracentron sinense]|uniref:RNA-dependent RNA polymerase n=1 Tax=Tetracentron sinense TaxID=13715 RepID=A0A834Y6D0_TETSI|nr:hypothetical protein LWB77_mgp14 [Tetracentron sinense]KAF8364959.1 hypothetical protein HHK36_033043 [Tetracentron sinense]KAF8376893.1 hypothetical protein HHK36_031403 [Tetracentron sinense]
MRGSKSIGKGLPTEEGRWVGIGGHSLFKSRSSSFGAQGPVICSSQSFVQIEDSHIKTEWERHYPLSGIFLRVNDRDSSFRRSSRALRVSNCGGRGVHYPIFLENNECGRGNSEGKALVKRIELSRIASNSYGEKCSNQKMGIRVVTIGRRSGLLFLALYLKQCSSSLQTAYGGVKPRQHKQLPVPIKLSRSGLPVPVEPGITWVPTWKSLPNSDHDFDRKAPSSPFTSMVFELTAFASQCQIIHSLEGMFSPGILWTKGYIYAPLDYSRNQTQTWKSLEWYERCCGPYLPTIEQVFPTVFIRMGKLASSIEGAGKRRIFAIGNAIKQSLLRPFHEWFMKILKAIPMDGTFAQSAPLENLRGLSNLYSFDLKSATDRWSLELLFRLVACLFPPNLAASLVQSTLGFNSFFVGKNMVKKPTVVCFQAGQPLGYLCSWPLFALSHHFVVWLAANRVYPGWHFKHYAILGDDVVIGDKRLACHYESIQLLNSIVELIRKLSVEV